MVQSYSDSERLFQTVVAAEGVTTLAGEATGLSLIDAGLVGYGANSFFSMLAVIYPGQPRLVDSQDITAFNNGSGEVTVAFTFKGGQVPAGVPYKIVTFRFVPAEVAALDAKVGANVDVAGTTTLFARLRQIVDTYLADGTVGLAAIKAYVDTLETSLGAFTGVENLKAILGDLATAKRLGQILGALDETNTLKAILGGYTAAAPLKTAIDTLTGYVDTEVADILLDTQIRKVASGTSGVIATTASKYIEIDSGVNGAEILGVIINGVVGFDWTLGVYVPTADAVAAPAAADKRDKITYLAADTEGGLLGPFGIGYNAFLKFTNDSGGNQTVNDVVVVYRSRGAITISAWT